MNAINFPTLLFALFVCAAAPPALAQCTDVDGDGFFYEDGCGTPTDCNDADPASYPGAHETCDGIDNNCDTLLDDDASCRRSCDFPGLTQPPVLAGDLYNSGSHTVIWAGTSYAAVWKHYPESPGLLFQRFDIDGNPIGARQRVTDSAFSDGPDLIWTGQEFGLVWHESNAGNYSRGTYFVVLNEDGTVRGDPTFLASSSFHPSVVWSGAEYGVAWNWSSVIGFARIDRDGQIIDGQLSVISDPPTGSSSMPSLAWAGSEYGVAWYDTRHYDPGGIEIYFARVSTEGTRIGPEVRVTTTATIDRSFRDPVLAWNETQYGLVWQVPSGTEILFAALDPMGQRLTGNIELSQDPAIAYLPSILSTGDEFGVVWADRRDEYTLGTLHLYFTRIDADSYAVEPPTRLMVGGWPELAWSGTNYAVLYGDYRDGLLYVGPVNCCAQDSDNDGADACADCNDTDPDVFPGATQICDGQNNDCSDPSWPHVPDDENDLDGDTYRPCDQDCDDTDPAIYPSAPQLCDGVNNDCSHPSWPNVPAEELDSDGDSLAICEGDCDDLDASVYPGAPQLCDGVNNDCANGAWPAVPADETDDDADQHAECEGDCDDTDPAVSPEADELCNAIDDNCNGLVDEDELGEDTDNDGVHNLCDNCRDTVNASQLDVDADGVGNSCDNCTLMSNTDQRDRDLDDRGDLCDNCPNDSNYFQDDYDADNHGDACDNCYFDYNPTQTDMDDDWEGDICDVDDGMIYIRFHQPEYVEWQEEIGYSQWNCYRGDLALLKSGGSYTQDPETVELAANYCGEDVPWVLDPAPPPSEAVFFLTTGASPESSLGTDSEGLERTNTRPCP